MSLSLLEVALALLSRGPSGGLILAGRNASGGAGREGPFPEMFLCANMELLGIRGKAPGGAFGLTLRPVNFAFASSTGSSLRCGIGI